MKIAIYRRKFRVSILELQNNKKFLIYYLTNKEWILRLFEFLLKIFHYPRLFPNIIIFWQNYSLIALKA